MSLIDGIRAAFQKRDPMEANPRNIDDPRILAGIFKLAQEYLAAEPKLTMNQAVRKAIGHAMKPLYRTIVRKQAEAALRESPIQPKESMYTYARRLSVQAYDEWVQSEKEAKKEAKQAEKVAQEAS